MATNVQDISKVIPNGARRAEYLGYLALRSNGTPEQSQKVQREVSEQQSQNKLGFFQKLWRATLIACSIIVGTPLPEDNKPFLRYYEQIRNTASESDAPAVQITKRAERLLSDSEAAIDYSKEYSTNVIPKDVGVPMSGMLSFLAGCDGTFRSNEQLQHNRFIKWWTKLLLQEPEKATKVIKILNDMDDTLTSKSRDPGFTCADKAIEIHDALQRTIKLMQELADSLGIKIIEGTNSARPLDETLTSSQLPGVEPCIKLGRLNGLGPEIYGDLETLEENIKHCRFTFLNANGYAGGLEKIFLSNKTYRAIDLLRHLEDRSNPDEIITIEIDGKQKTFVEALFTDPAHEYAIAESKKVAGYIYDTNLALEEGSYYDHYLKIANLKKECINDKLMQAKESGATKEELARIEEECLKQFQEKLLANVNAGIPKWQKVIQIRKGLNECEKKKKAGELIPAEVIEKKNIALNNALADAMLHVRLIGADSTEQVSNDFKGQNHYALLSSNNTNDIRRFIRLATRGELAALTMHYYNRFLTPFDRRQRGGLDAVDRANYILKQFANHSKVRRLIAKENMYTNRRELHQDIKKFRDHGIELLKKEGVKSYLDWRMLEHLSLHYTQEQLEAIDNQRAESGEKKLFSFSTGPSRERLLDFSDEFKAERNTSCAGFGSSGYIQWTKEHFKNSGGPEAELISIIDTFLPENIEDIESLRSLNESDLQQLEWLYPNEMFIRNSSRGMFAKNGQGGNGDRSFYPIFSFVDKREIQYCSTPIASTRAVEIPYLPPSSIEDKRFKFYGINKLNQDGWIYWELLGNRDKDSGVDLRDNLLDKDGFQTTALTGGGDSTSDLEALAAILLRNGLANQVLFKYNERKLYEAIIKLCIEDYGKFMEKLKKDPEQFKEYCAELKEQSKEFGNFFLRKKKNGNYEKIVRFEGPDYEHRTPILEFNPRSKNYEFTKEELIEDFKRIYGDNFVAHSSPEVYIYRMLETLELLLGKHERFIQKDFAKAQELCKRQLNGETNFSSDELNLIARYKQAVREQNEAFIIPPNAPRCRIWREYRVKDESSQVTGIVYKNKDNVYVLDELNGNNPIPYNKDISKLEKIEIEEDEATGKFKYFDPSSNQLKDYETPERLNNILQEEKYLPPFSPKSGLLTNKFLLWLLGKDDTKLGKARLKKLVGNIPFLFSGLLKYSGALMAIGGIVRIVSKFSGNLEGVLYTSGYWISNSVRAVSALGGALRGVLNPQKYPEICVGEGLNIIASFLPNKSKYWLLGLGNSFLFFGRGRQEALINQKVNNHSESMIEGHFNKSIDPRPKVREVTQFSTNLILGAMKKLENFGLPKVVGKTIGQAVSMLLTPFKMVGDVINEPRLAGLLEKRKSDKNGILYWTVPSVGHLMATVGALSGIGAVVGATVGRVKAEAEDGFNWFGKYFAIPFATAIPAIGIILKGLQVATNPDGLQRITRTLNGKDIKIDYIRAGLGQAFSGVLYLILPWFGLHKDLVAAGYDTANGRYFIGAGEEEKINGVQVASTIARRADEHTTDAETLYTVAA
ncbi:MAG: hypothetical protein HYY52_02790 [Candidatus Melainabacteria bacterium]|nr:hypothetical protein [Candidatus Melainabacteria bacterium]